MREIITQGKAESVVDVDGSYLYKKYKLLTDLGTNVNPLGPPPLPLQGWISVPLSPTASASPSLVSSLPSVTAGS